MRKLATLTAAAALLAAGGLLLAPNVAWAQAAVTILACNEEANNFDVEACESTDVAICTAGTGVFAANASCSAALNALLTTHLYGGRKAYQFSPVAGVNNDLIIYTLTKGD